MGAASSHVSIPVADLGSTRQILQISFASTSPLLSNRVGTLFYRTVPPDDFQTRAIIDIIQHFNWTQVSIIYVGDSYRQPGAQALRQLAMDNSICIDMDSAIGLDFTTGDYQALAEMLLSSDSDIVIYSYMTKM